MLAVFIERCGAHAMQLAAGKCRFQKVGGIHCAIRFASANQGVHFVDEQDNAAVLSRNFLQNGFEALFKFAAVFRAGNQCS